MRTKIPKIYIKYSKLLDPIFIFYCKNNPELKKRGWNDWVPPSKKEVLERIENYKKEWSLYEKDILEGMSKILGLEFKQNIIDVYIVSGTSRQFSHPIIIKSGFTPNEFVDTLTHELIHKLFQDNIDIFPWSILSEMFPKESKTTKNHIITHATLKYIYLDILKDNNRLEKNLIRSKKDSMNDYTRAWEIVEKRGYLKLINNLKTKLKIAPS